MEKPVTSQGYPLDTTEIYENLFDFINNVLFRLKLSTNESGENKITQNIEFVLNKEAHDQNTFCISKSV
jgi:hypothetical protein